MPLLVLTWEANVSKPAHLRKEDSTSPMWTPGGSYRTALCGHYGKLYDDLQVLDVARLEKSCPGCVGAAALIPGCTGLYRLPGADVPTKKPVSTRLLLQRINRRLRKGLRRIKKTASGYTLYWNGQCTAENVDLALVAERLSVLRPHEVYVE